MHRRYSTLLKPSDRPLDQHPEQERTEASAASPAPMPKKPRPTQKKAGATKLFVLDTNVLMHDPTSLFRFEEHDVYLPIGDLEELDNHKRGLSDVARNARQARRFLDEIVSDSVADIQGGLPLPTRDGEPSGGRLYLQTEAINGELPPTFAAGKTDNQI